MVASACEQCNTGGGVGLVGFEVEVDSDGANGDQTREVDVQMMRLRTVGSILFNQHTFISMAADNLLPKEPNIIIP